VLRGQWFFVARFFYCTPRTLQTSFSFSLSFVVRFIFCSQVFPRQSSPTPKHKKKAGKRPLNYFRTAKLKSWNTFYYASLAGAAAGGSTFFSQLSDLHSAGLDVL
jgi:hypothetical protein